MTEEQALQYVKTADEKTLKELGKQYCVGFELTDKIPSVFESKIGGIPYFPTGAEIPYNSYGDQLRFLMQINCSDIHGIDNYPQKGMLQFWIDIDDTWGMCDKNGKGFRVIYYSDIIDNHSVPQITELTEEDEEFFPLCGEYGIEFKPVMEDTNKKSIAYNRVFCKYFNLLSDEKINYISDLKYKLHLSDKILEDGVYANACNYIHKIGGSPEFCQYDIRDSEEEQEKFDFQLLQLNSDFGRNFTKIMWGDAGICHFFINSGKLKNCNFSDINYHCDCC
ncbi:MAG: YwqG family protein [Oscillospiraceae bacterium]|nr:YwqG family protein [Oscillospiraceae bacterium]